MEISLNLFFISEFFSILKHFSFSLKFVLRKLWLVMEFFGSFGFCDLPNLSSATLLKFKENLYTEYRTGSDIIRLKKVDAFLRTIKTRFAAGIFKSSFSFQVIFVTMFLVIFVQLNWFSLFTKSLYFRRSWWGLLFVVFSIRQP